MENTVKNNETELFEVLMDKLDILDIERYAEITDSLRERKNARDIVELVSMALGDAGLLASFIPHPAARGFGIGTKGVTLVLNKYVRYLEKKDAA